MSACDNIWGNLRDHDEHIDNAVAQESLRWAGDLRELGKRERPRNGLRASWVCLCSCRSATLGFRRRLRPGSGEE